jgi:hypothetical protein
MTTSRLAEIAGYRSHDGINLQYGRLAQRISKQLPFSRPRINLLVALLPPKSVTNKQWVLVMHQEFAEALNDAKWI